MYEVHYANLRVWKCTHNQYFPHFLISVNEVRCTCKLEMLLLVVCCWHPPMRGIEILPFNHRLLLNPMKGFVRTFVEILRASFVPGGTLLGAIGLAQNILNNEISNSCQLTMLDYTTLHFTSLVINSY